MQADSDDPQVAEALAQYTSAVSQYDAELQQQYRLPPEAQQALRGAVERCFEGACAALEQRHAALRETEAENSRVLNSRCVVGVLACTRCVLGACMHKGREGGAGTR